RGSLPAPDSQLSQPRLCSNSPACRCSGQVRIFDQHRRYDMLPVFYKQIRQFREQRQSVETQRSNLDRIASSSADALRTEAQKIVTELRSIRSNVRNDDPAIVRAAIAAVVDRIEICSKPATTKTRARRVLQKLRIFFKTPICTVGSTLCSAL